MPRASPCIALLILCLAARNAAAGDGGDAPARNLAAACTGCHADNVGGSDGMSSLRGVSRAWIKSRMQEFRTGVRPATVMQQIALAYTGEQIDLIAAWFAAQAPSAPAASATSR